MTRHEPLSDGSAAKQITSAIRIDADGQMTEVSGEFALLDCVSEGSPDVHEALIEYLGRFDMIDSSELSDLPEVKAGIVERWSTPDRPAVEARAKDGSWRLLSCCLFPDGGTLYLSVNIDRQKSYPDLAQFVMDHLPLPMWMNDAEDGSVVYSNRAANRLYSVEADVQDDRHVADFFTDRERSLEMLNTLQTKGTIENFPVETKTASGKEILVNGCATLGEFRGRKVAVSAIQDLTDRRELADDTLKARDMLRDAIESVSEGFALYDEDSRLVMFNNAYRDMNRAVADILEPGLEWEILMRETARRGVYADAVGREAQWISERIDNGIEYIQDYELRQTDGSCYLVSVHPTKLGGFVVTRSDITAKKQAESAQRDGDLLIRQVLEASPAAVVMARVGDGEILYRSPAALELFGKIKYASEFFKSVDDRADYITRLLADERVDDYDLTLINANQEEFPASAYGRFAEYKGEEVAVTTIIDRTNRTRRKRSFERFSKPVRYRFR